MHLPSDHYNLNSLTVAQIQATATLGTSTSLESTVDSGNAYHPSPFLWKKSAATALIIAGWKKRCSRTYAWAHTERNDYLKVWIKKFVISVSCKLTSSRAPHGTVLNFIQFVVFQHTFEYVSFEMKKQAFKLLTHLPLTLLSWDSELTARTWSRSGHSSFSLLNSFLQRETTKSSRDAESRISVAQKKCIIYSSWRLSQGTCSCVRSSVILNLFSTYLIFFDERLSSFTGTWLVLRRLSGRCPSWSSWSLTSSSDSNLRRL